MSIQLATILINAAVALLVGGGLATWMRYGPERKKLKAETNSIIVDDWKDAYDRVCDDLAQTQMRLKACEAENENCRERVLEMQESISLLTLEMARQGKLTVLSRARAHIAGKTLMSYELHIEALLDEIRHHNESHPHYRIIITPMMRTRALRAAYEAQMSKVEAMEALELEALMKQTYETEVVPPPSE